MRRILMRLSAPISALALGMAGLHAAGAADLGAEAPPQGQYQPPPAYGPPPVEQGYAYPPPAVAYPYAAPPPVAYYAYPAPFPAVVPGPYYAWRGPYWRGYGPRFAYGYGHWGHGHRW